MDRSESDAAAPGWPAILLANALVFATLAWAAGLEARDPEVYYRALQEDGALEWSTFWAFLLAAGGYATAALRSLRHAAVWPWFPLGVALFCFVVAMEEISWGQRVLGFQPPTYFLENNFQQELNLHNVVETSLRKLALQGIILGYGVALPLLALVPVLRSFLARLGVTGPPAGLSPAFFAMWATYAEYPWQFTGEVVEGMLGLGFLADAAMRAFAADAARWRSLAAVAASAGVAFAFGQASAVWSHQRISSDPGALEAARTELEALKRDLSAHARDRATRDAVRCGLHKRLYGVANRRGGEFLRQGEFVELVERGLPEQRADYLIDPWSSPYWIRFECDEETERRTLFLYSFGPNRLRDSSEWEIRGDDVGVYLVRPRPPAG